MLSFLPGVIRGILSIILIIINTVFIFFPLILSALAKLSIPVQAWHKACDRVIIFISTSWVKNNALILRLMHKIKWDIEGLETLNTKEWYLVVANHQSWVDIFVLQTVFLRRIPFIKFFLKKELIWVPLMGLAWWALDFPFMKRYSSEFIKKNPHLKGKDIEITRKACEKFKRTPISVMNFLEGTRYSESKHSRQNSPYKHLLKPKAGGIAFVLGAMGEHLSSMLNVTIAYPYGTQNFWGFLCGRVPEVRVHIEVLPITDEILGDYFNDDEYKNRFHEWVNRLWEEKDRKIKSMMKKS